MASQFDESDFVDGDFVATQKTFNAPAYASAASAAAAPQPATAAPHPLAAPMNRPPTREELESKVNETQARLSELKRAQEELERQRAALEEARRRRIEFQNGREEMLQHLTRGIGILEESEFSARREAEQMRQAVADMKAALEKVQAMHEENWSDDDWQQELTRSLTTLENARMEWNSARVKFTILDGALKSPEEAKYQGVAGLLKGQNFADLCKIGLALTWPVAAVTLVSAIVIIAALMLRK